MNEKKQNKVLDFVIKTMNGMAYGLFSTLIIGTIIGTVGSFFGEKTLVFAVLNSLAAVLKNLTGIGIGLGIAWSLKLDGLKLITACVAGGVSSYMSGIKIWELFNLSELGYESFTNYFSKLSGFKVGDPLTVYIVVIGTVLLMNLVLKKKTPVDIILIPLFTTMVAGLISILIGGPVAYITTAIGNFVNTATELQPFIMGVIISVVMGMALTAPISSAAIAVTIGLTGLAGGAAVVGCCVQMLGFAVMSRKDNNIGTVISVGIGTSMLQFKNILKKPIIWLPTIIVSAILGPIGTCLFKVECVPSGAGMGTSGLVGIIGTIEAMGGFANAALSVFVLLIALPIVLVFITDVIFRHFNLIKENDLKI